MRVIVESPFASPDLAEIQQNVLYARKACRDSIKRGEVPFASHLIYPQPGILNDADPNERAQGISLGYEWWPFCEKIVFYIDRGMSNGMASALQRAISMKLQFEFRRLDPVVGQPQDLDEAEKTTDEDVASATTMEVPPPPEFIKQPMRGVKPGKP